MVSPNGYVLSQCLFVLYSKRLGGFAAARELNSYFHVFLSSAKGIDGDLLPVVVTCQEIRSLVLVHTRCGGCNRCKKSVISGGRQVEIESGSSLSEGIVLCLAVRRKEPFAICIAFDLCGTSCRTFRCSWCLIANGIKILIHLPCF